MADKIIGQLTHDNKKFEEQWSTIFTRLNDSFIECEEKTDNIPRYKCKAFDALVDYVIANTKISSEPFSTKLIFVERVAYSCATDPQPSLAELVRIFRRILDQSNIFNRWYAEFLKKAYHEFNLGENLCEKPSIDLIDSILKSLEKHSFSNGKADKKTADEWEEFLANRLLSSSSSDRNRITTEETMEKMRPAFQRFLRFAARMAPQSSVWSAVVASFRRGLPTLFDQFENANDASAALDECQDGSSMSTEYLELLSSSYRKDVNLVKKNFSQLLSILERLILAKRLDDASRFYDNTIDEHFDTSIDIEALLKTFTRLCSQVEIRERDQFCRKIIRTMVSKLEDIRCKKQLAPLFFDFALAILDLHVIDAPPCTKRLLEKNEFYPWKELAPKCANLVRSCSTYDMIEKGVVWMESCRVDDIISLLHKRSQVHKAILQSTHAEAFKAILRWLNPPPNCKRKRWSIHVYQIANHMTKLLDPRQMTMDGCAQLIDGLRQGISQRDTDDDEDDDESQYLDGWMGSFYRTLASTIASHLERFKPLSTSIHRQIASYVLAALACPLLQEDGDQSFEQQSAKELWMIICECVTNEQDAQLYEPCLQQIITLARDEEQPELYGWYNTYWNEVGKHCPTMATNHLEEFLRHTIDQKDPSLFLLLRNLYSKRSESYHARLNDFLIGIFHTNTSYAATMAHLFILISQEHPEIIQSKHVDQLFTSMKNKGKSAHEISFVFQGLASVATIQPQLFDKHRSQLMDFVTEYQDISALMCLKQYFISSTIVHGEVQAKEYLTILIQLLKDRRISKNEIRSQIFHTCEMIGMIHRQALETKRNDLLTFQSQPECRIVINMIDGKKMNDEQQAVINQSREEIMRVRKRIGQTENNVQQMNTAVNQQSKEVKDLGTRVKVVDKRLNQVDDKVQKQAREIERIDAKTLSHVPAEWGSEVSKLLNRRADNDWRLLGKRFGYSTSELRHWALQADPAMFLLNEWFLTHKADEATYGLVKMLDDIGRQDASKIIREAVAATGNLIPDDIPFEIKRLPPIFLSYQWGTQKAVTTLKQNLESAGYACWMDIGQMGGGDKLFAKIDAGIRGAKVMICCINAAYAQSDNCLREVHLAVSTGKPIIPLQMEKQKWPPEGALGPILSEYLYIRFYDRKANANDYWPVDKFPELLGQIRYHVAPNLDMIKDQYKNWFEPRVDHLIFLQPKAAEGKEKQVALKDNSAPLDVKHPHIMISYQWDRQKDVVALYTRLTELGYRCWLDIFQMGGGDSLFEKIDDGIRHTQCVLACVTPNYTKSINCKREMSLADALKKPIVPLYLEETSTWPPPGPMSLVFTDKTYIDFRHLNSNAGLWSSKEFDQLQSRLKKLIPDLEIKSFPSSTSSGTNQNMQSQTCSIL